jgi:hypothetical protein
MSAMRVSSIVGVAVVVVSLVSAPVLAGLNDPIIFSQAGTVTLTINESSGGFDHILELSASTGPVGTPVMALTDFSAPSPDVLGFTPALPGESTVVGSFAAGEEIVFRLTNVGSPRLGDVGVVDSQVFSGSASANNPFPADFYTFVEFVDATTINVFFEDVFPVSSADPDPENTFFTSGYDVAFTLTLVPVPEPATFLLASAGLTAVACRRVWR